MGRYLAMVNQQMVMLGQLKSMALLQAPTHMMKHHLVTLKAQASLFRMRTGQHPYPALEVMGEDLLAQIGEPQALKETFYQNCVRLSQQALELLEEQLFNFPEQSSELPAIIQATRDEIRELKDWVVLLAGGVPPN